MKKIYFDYAAATPMHSAVLKAMQPYFADKFQNPSATYLAAQQVKTDLDAARAKVAYWLGARPGQIIFTAGGTEANNLALFGVAVKHQDAHIVSTALEHESILKPLEYLKQQGWTYTLVKPGSDGVVDPAAIAKAVTDKTVLVSVMYANNEIGTIQPIKDIARQLEKIRQARQLAHTNQPLYLHTDACQASNYLDLHVSRLGVDLMTLNGGKIYGPKQSGVLYVSKHVVLDPIIFGGGQELGLRSGTENVPGIIGFATALELVQTKRQQETDRLKALQHLFIDLVQAKLPSAVLNGSTKHRLVNNVHLTFAGSDNERLLYGLDEAGIQCAAGSACSASNDEPSHVLKAIGLTDEAARASLRFTMGRHTSEQDIRQLVTTLVKLVA